MPKKRSRKAIQETRKRNLGEILDTIDMLVDESEVHGENQIAGIAISLHCAVCLSMDGDSRMLDALVDRCGAILSAIAKCRNMDEREGN